MIATATESKRGKYVGATTRRETEAARAMLTSEEISAFAADLRADSIYRFGRAPFRVTSRGVVAYDPREKAPAKERAIVCLLSEVPRSECEAFGLRVIDEILDGPVILSDGSLAAPNESTVVMDAGRRLAIRPTEIVVPKKWREPLARPKHGPFDSTSWPRFLEIVFAVICRRAIKGRPIFIIEAEDERQVGQVIHSLAVLTGAETSRPLFCGARGLKRTIADEMDARGRHDIAVIEDIARPLDGSGVDEPNAPIVVVHGGVEVSPWVPTVKVRVGRLDPDFVGRTVENSREVRGILFAVARDWFAQFPGMAPGKFEETVSPLVAWAQRSRDVTQ